MRLALAGGGTGGHLVPGLHLLEQLRARGTLPEDVLWFSSGRAVEERVLARLPERAAGVPIERVTLALESEGAPSWLRLAARTAAEVRRARRALERHGSEVLLGLGGFTVLPAVLAARAQGIPVILLELNVVPGKATRVLAGLAERVVHAWPDPSRGAGGRRVCLGPPLAPVFASALPSEERRGELRAALGFEAARPLLLVLGGSQGALGLNRFLAAQAPALVAAGLQVLHQTGPGRLLEGASAQPGYRAVEYLDAVPTALDAATLVLCRGGASTLAEIAARARPALVVPYPHHADRHQEKNALALGAGVRVVPEERLGAELVPMLAELAHESGARARAAMTRALFAALPRDGVERLAEELLLVAGRFRTNRGRTVPPAIHSERPHTR
jgi:UDP-N-acetylglucosamine--N-acetylmuramyl-(pentapeptide) pyrophosphoryl-undecaprenol N-acetylglucosamine transferase